MSRFAKAHSTDLNQPDIVRALEGLGCSVWDIGRPVDLLIEWDGSFLVLEVKNPHGKNQLTPWQKRFFARTKGPAAIVRTVDEAVAFVKGWKDAN